MRIFIENLLLRTRDKLLLTALAVVMSSGGVVRGEQFMTINEASKVMLPGADRFQSATVRFSPEQRKAIEKASEFKVRNRGNRMVLGYAGDSLIGILLIDHVLGKHELIDYAVALDPSGKVLAVEILNYRESHGGEITRQKWREQFEGKDRKSPLKLHDDIFNISGATISCRSVTQGIRRLLATYKEVVRPRLLATGDISLSSR